MLWSAPSTRGERSLPTQMSSTWRGDGRVSELAGMVLLWCSSRLALSPRMSRILPMSMVGVYPPKGSGCNRGGRVATSLREFPMRAILTFTLISLSFVACGGGGAKPDAPVTDLGFNKPSAGLKANMEGSNSSTWTEIGPADLTCLNTPSADQATTVPVTLNTVINDFQYASPVP